MSLKFFSQFLILENIVEDSQLQAAISEAGVSHKTLGQLAVESGFITSQNAIDLNQEQLKRDMPLWPLCTHTFRDTWFAHHSATQDAAHVQDCAQTLDCACRSCCACPLDICVAR